MPSKLNRLIRLFVLVITLLASIPSTGRASGMDTPTSAAAGGTSLLLNPASASSAIEIRADSFGVPLAADQVAGMYARPSVFLVQDASVRFKVSVDTEALYTISLDLAASDSSLINAPEGQLSIDGAIPENETGDFIFPVFYTNTIDAFPLDR